MSSFPYVTSYFYSPISQMRRRDHWPEKLSGDSSLYTDEVASEAISDANRNDAGLFYQVCAITIRLNIGCLGKANPRE
jgi:hypothetical protein